ncbi:hypothetical protein [Pendulispora albinea]|uniref:Uncharacterized protein n=1 Tax=Pendulispora albinea TaxID=2741071 RepID=A0ABZ2MAL4_9BACT
MGALHLGTAMRSVSSAGSSPVRTRGNTTFGGGSTSVVVSTGAGASGESGGLPLPPKRTALGRYGFLDRRARTEIVRPRLVVEIRNDATQVRSKNERIGGPIGWIFRERGSHEPIENLGHVHTFPKT